MSWLLLVTLVAPEAIPSSFEPSVATSRPSTVPVTVMFPVTSIPAVKSWFPVDVIGPSLETATEAVPFSIVVLSTAVVEALVINPLASTVRIGIAELEP